MRWRDPVKVTDPIPTTGDYDEGSMGRLGSLVLNVWEFQEPVLYAVALSSKPIEKAGELMSQGQRRWKPRVVADVYE